MAYTDPIIRRFAVACGVLSQYTSQPADIEPAGGEQQLTIFYAGRMVVVDRCTPARAAELIRYAAAAQQSGAPEPPALVDMPIARKASLQRFLTKRKYRANAIVPEPYGLPAAAPEQPPPAKKSKAADGERRQDDWLALGSLGDMHAR